MFNLATSHVCLPTYYLFLSAEEGVANPAAGSFVLYIESSSTVFSCVLGGRIICTTPSGWKYLGVYTRVCSLVKYVPSLYASLFSWSFLGPYFYLGGSKPCSSASVHSVGPWGDS